MKENKYIISYIQDNKIVTIERTETEEELKERIKCYRKNNIEIVGILKEVVIKTYEMVKER